MPFMGLDDDYLRYAINGCKEYLMPFYCTLQMPNHIFILPPPAS